MGSSATDKPINLKEQLSLEKSRSSRALSKGERDFSITLRVSVL
jgi:hypothetical protein